MEEETGLVRKIKTRKLFLRRYKMPGGDRRGPSGQGPKTGKGRGLCTGSENTRDLNASPGTGFGRGFGRGSGRGFGNGMRNGMRNFKRIGRGFGCGFFPGVATQNISNADKNEMEILKQEAQMMENSLDSIKERISQLENTVNQNKDENKTG